MAATHLSARHQFLFWPTRTIGTIRFCAAVEAMADIELGVGAWRPSGSIFSG